MKKRIISIIMVLTLLFSMSISVWAEDLNVSYEGGAEKFVFLNGSNKIFDNFKNIAPGEERTQNITLTNNHEDRMRFFMKVAADGELGDAAVVYVITITRDNEELYTGTIQGLAELSRGTMEESLMLADLEKGTDVEVQMTVGLDETLDNTYQNQRNDIQFVFGVDTPPENEGENKTVYKKGPDKTVYQKGAQTVRTVKGSNTSIAGNAKTGDENPLGMYLIILGLGFIGAVALVYRKSKGQREE